MPSNGQTQSVVSSRTGIRVLFLFIILGSAGFAVQSYLGYQTDSPVYQANNSSVSNSVASPQGPTVFTTSPKRGSTAYIAAYDTDGKLEYYNQTYEYYYDVDPVKGEKRTVEYVATDILDSEKCPEEVEEGCHYNVIERVNLSTGAVQRLHTDFAVGAWGGWHDFDRLNDTRLLVGGIKGDRIMVLNTETDLVEWQWEAGSTFQPESGGVFDGDWTHINDVEELPNGQYMLSARNQDRVLFIDPETGVVENRTLGAEDDRSTLYEQHNPDYIPASRGGPAVLVADSENDRVVEYQWSEAGWNRTWGYSDVQMQWPRDADRLPNGNTLIVDSNGNRVLELGTEGEIVWSISANTPYDVERLGTGDESEGGPAATKADLVGKNVEVETTTTTDDEQDRTLGYRAIELVRSLIPGIVLNGILFVIPTWMGFLDLAAVLGCTGTLVLWVGAEFYWRGYRVSLPLYRV